MTKVHIEGEIDKPVPEASMVMREYLLKYFEKKGVAYNSISTKYQSALEFIDEVKVELLDWLVQLEEFQ